MDAYLKNNYPDKIEKINQVKKVSVRLDKKNHNDSNNNDQEGGVFNVIKRRNVVKFLHFNLL